MRSMSSFFSNLLAYQQTEDIKGDMLEIGTYQGKSAILMGYGLRDDEELVICDLFSAVMDHADIPLNRRQQYSGLEQRRVPGQLGSFPHSPANT